MTAPEPGTQDLAEKVAQVWRDSHPDWKPWVRCSPNYREDLREIAGEFLDAIRAAGLAVVELPGTVVGSRYTHSATGAPIFEIGAPSPDGRGWEITGQYVPGLPGDRVTVEGGIGWSSTDRARLDALRILAACDAVERLRAEHRGGDPR